MQPSQPRSATDLHAPDGERRAAKARTSWKPPHSVPLGSYNGPVLGERVRRARREKGWGVAQLSKRSGVPERIIREIEGESPTYVPSEANTELLAETLRIPVGLLRNEREWQFGQWRR